MALAIALFSDGVDLVLVGLIPGIGDVLDLLTIALLYRFLGLYTLGGLAELIPVVDIFPTYTALVLAAHFTGKGRFRDE